MNFWARRGILAIVHALCGQVCLTLPTAEDPTFKNILRNADIVADQNPEYAEFLKNEFYEHGWEREGLIKLHRTPGEYKLRVFKILLMISSYDRGERAVGFQGDKLEFIKQQLKLAGGFCSRSVYGAKVYVSAVFFSTWDVLGSLKADGIQRRLLCRGRELQLEMHVFDHGIRGALTGRHRYLVKSALAHYDLFVHLEDDMLMRWAAIAVYLRYHRRLPRGYRVGFHRVEIKDNASYIFEYPLHSYSSRRIHKETYVTLTPGSQTRTPWYAGMWMATQAEIIHLNRSCDPPFLSPDALCTFHPACVGDDNIAHGKEFWGGGLQISLTCPSVRAIVAPLKEFTSLAVVHASGNYLHRKGYYVTPVSAILEKLA